MHGKMHKNRLEKSKNQRHVKNNIFVTEIKIAFQKIICINATEITDFLPSEVLKNML